MRKRNKAYRPIPISRDPMGSVMVGMMPARMAESVMVQFGIKKHLALKCLVDGIGTKDDLMTLTHAFILAQSFAGKRMRLGTEYIDILDSGGEALLAIATRFNKWGKYQVTPSEATAMKLALEVYDAQLDVCSVAELERAVVLAKEAIRCNGRPKVVDISHFDKPKNVI